jgi:phage tail-like protein
MTAECPVSSSSSLLQYLPAPFHGDPFLAQFLHVFEDIFGSIEQRIDTLAWYFDPLLTPPEVLPWLAGWIGIELDENWPLARRRQLVRWAAQLYRLRGTRRGMRTHLELYSGYPPLIVENFDGLRLGQDGGLGATARLGTTRQNWIDVTVLTRCAEEVDESIVRQIIEFQKPASVAYRFAIANAPDTADGEGAADE